MLEICFVVIQKLFLHRIYLDFFRVFADFILELFLVKKFVKHIDKDMITRLFLTQLEKVTIFRPKHTFSSLTWGPK